METSVSKAFLAEALGVAFDRAYYFDPWLRREVDARCHQYVQGALDDFAVSAHWPVCWPRPYFRYASRSGRLRQWWSASWGARSDCWASIGCSPTAPPNPLTPAGFLAATIGTLAISTLCRAVYAVSGRRKKGPGKM